MKYSKVLYCADWFWGAFVFVWLGFKILPHSVLLAILSFVVAAAGVIIFFVARSRIMDRAASGKIEKWKIALWVVLAAILVLLLVYGHDRSLMDYVIVVAISILLSVAAEMTKLRVKRTQ